MSKSDLGGKAAREHADSVSAAGDLHGQRAHRQDDVALMATIPAGITALGPEVERELERLIAVARDRDDRELAAALNDALKVIPLPLRGVARKVLSA